VSCVMYLGPAIIFPAAGAAFHIKAAHAHGEREADALHLLPRCLFFRLFYVNNLIELKSDETAEGLA
jgi:hypothetical protein